jgi:hypothetical protein
VAEPALGVVKTVSDRVSLTTSRLIDELAMCARPAVRGYGEDVVARMRPNGGAVVAHPPAPCEIRVILAGVDSVVGVGWRIETGWFAAVRSTVGERSVDIRYRPGSDLIDRILPRVSRVAHWLGELSANGSASTPSRPPVRMDAAVASDIVARLHRCFPAPSDSYACWTHGRLVSGTLLSTT